MPLSLDNKPMVMDIEHLEVHKSRRAKRLALRVDSSRCVIRLVIPPHTSMRRAEEFAYLNRDWIAEKVSNFPKIIPFEDNETIPIFGQDKTINITYDASIKTTRIRVEDDRIHVHTNQDDITSRLSRHLKRLVKDEISILARNKAARIDKKIDAISVRDTKSRWGSCSSTGTLSFSWRLIFAPYIALDYVVAHEVAHLVHMDHSKNFWSLCCDLSDEYVKGKKWMNTHGHTLHGYGRT